MALLKLYCFAVFLGYGLKSLPYLQGPLGDGGLPTSPPLTDNRLALLHSPAIAALFDCLKSATFFPGSSFWNAFLAFPSGLLIILQIACSNVTLSIEIST